MNEQTINLETEDWRLGCFLDWQPKYHQEVCPRCKGSKQINTGFHHLDDPEPCPDCHGSGTVTKKGPRTPKPEIPKALREHLRRAWWDFFNLPDPEKNRQIKE